MWWSYTTDFFFSHSSWNNRFNKTHPNMWTFIVCWPGKEVIFRQQSLKFKAGSPKTLSTQEQIDDSGTHF
jgi:hypothetical protein